MLAWAPYPGGQELYLSAHVPELFADGNRGGGKTELALADYARDVGRWGASWRGLILRREYKHLDDVLVKAKRLFRRWPWQAQGSDMPRWVASKSDYRWTWPTGEELLLRAAKDIEDYWAFHGHEYPFVHFEELTSWPTGELYDALKSVNRCSVAGVRRRYSSNSNPFGPGHGWVKERFVDPAPAGVVVVDETEFEHPVSGKLVTLRQERARVTVKLEENLALLNNDPGYVAKLEQIGNPEMRQAWRYGDWDIAAGGFLAGAWDPRRHICAPFEIPDHWPRWRAMDWGYSKPYSVGWYTRDQDGVIYRYRELYGWGGKANAGTRESAREVARKIKGAEAREEAKGIKFKANPADSAIWAEQGAEITVAELFHREKVAWLPAKKGPNSRRSQAQLVIDALREDRLKVFESCRHFLRTVPVLMPDPDDWDDVDTEMEDHCWDELRYSLASRHRAAIAPTEPPRQLTPFTLATLERVTAKPPKKRSPYRLR